MAGAWRAHGRHAGVARRAGVGAWCCGGAGSCCAPPRRPGGSPNTRIAATCPAPQVTQKDWYGFMTWTKGMKGVNWLDSSGYDGTTQYDLVRA